MHIPSRTRQGVALLLSKLLPDRGGRVDDLVHRFLKLLAAHAEMLGPIADLMFFVHRDFAAVGVIRAFPTPPYPLRRDARSTHSRQLLRATVRYCPFSEGGVAVDAIGQVNIGPAMHLRNQRWPNLNDWAI
jgi:hypothetical protein